jgi:hypothetical protein
VSFPLQADRHLRNVVLTVSVGKIEKHGNRKKGAIPLEVETLCNPLQAGEPDLGLTGLKTALAFRSDTTQ